MKWKNNLLKICLSVLLVLILSSSSKFVCSEDRILLPTFIISSWKPLAQDIINYTPKGTKTDLKLTVATDIKTDRHEYEIDRQRQVRLYNDSYDLVTIKGDLYIRNCKTKDVTMEIKKGLTGEIIEVSHKGKTEKTAEGLKGVNYNSFISWEIPLKAGEESNITYKYKVYITH